MDALPAGFFDGLADDPDPAMQALYGRVKGKRFTECSKPDQKILNVSNCRSSARATIYCDHYRVVHKI